MANAEKDPYEDLKWKSTQPGDNYMIKAKEMAPARGRSLGQRIVGYIRNDKRKSEVVEVAVPHLPYHIWIDTAGNVVQVPYKTNRVHEVDGDRTKSIDTGDHAVRQDEIHYGEGWLRYETGGRGEPRERWLARRESVIAERRADQAGYMKECDDRLRNDQKNDPKAFREMMTTFVQEAISEGANDRKSRAEKRKALDGGGE